MQLTPSPACAAWDRPPRPVRRDFLCPRRCRARRPGQHLEPCHNHLSFMSQEDRDREGSAERGGESGMDRRGGRFGSDTTTRGIRIQVTSRYLPDRSSPKEGTYLFTYHV